MIYQHAHSQFSFTKNTLEYRKSFFRKPIVLVLAVVYTILTLLSIVQTLMPNFLISTEEITLILGAKSTPYISIANAFNSIILLIITLSVWIIYLKSNSRNPMSNPRSGLNILYILSLISLIFAIMSSLLIIALAVMFFVIGPDFIFNEINEVYPELSDISNLLSTGIIIFLLIIAFLILLHPIANFKFIASLKSKEKYSYLPIKGCMLLGILNIPLAISYVSSIFLYPTTYTYLLNEKVINGNLVLFEKMNYFPMIYLGLYSILTIIMVILPLYYRSYAKRVNLNLNNIVQHS